VNGIASALRDLLAGAQSRHVRARVPEKTIWEVTGTGLEAERLRTEILNVILKGPIEIAYDEELDPRLNEALEARGDQVFRLRGQVEVGRLREWLSAGNWQLFSPAAPTERMDLLRAAPSQIAEYLKAHGLDVAVDSFHDNNPWLVAWR
jgi:hypothetical protein